MLAALTMSLHAPLIRQLISLLVLVVMVPYLFQQVRKPTRWVGRLFLWSMNRSHSPLTDWGLEHVRVGKNFAILDVGCGGGRTIGKLAAMATEGKVWGIDYSPGSIAASRSENAGLIAAGRVEILPASVSKLPFEDASFDLVTAIETHYYWPHPADDVREIRRVLKPGGELILIAEVYRSAGHLLDRLAMAPLRVRLLTLDEHRELLAEAGLSEVRVETEPRHGWICAVGRRPA